MAYFSTSRTVTVKDTYSSSHWSQVSVTVTCAADGTLTYSAKATQSGNANDTGLYLAIDGYVIYNDYYTSNSSFPGQNNSTAKGTVKNSNNVDVKATRAFFTVDLRVCCRQDGNVGNRWTDGTATKSYQEVYRTSEGTAPTKPTITAGAKGASFTLKCDQGKSGTNNPIQATVIFYTIDGKTPTFDASGNPLGTTQKESFSGVSGGKCEKPITPSVSNTYTVKAIARSSFLAGTKWTTQKSGTASQTITYWTDGKKPSLSLSKNTMGTEVTATYTNGAAGTNNALSKSTLYYTTDGTAPGPGIGSTIPEALETGTGQKSFKITGLTKDTTIKAIVRNNFANNWVESDMATVTTTYRTDGSAPAKPTITDNGNNTFTVKYYHGANGTSNSRTGSTIYYKTPGASNYTSEAFTDSKNVSFTSDGTVYAYSTSTFTYDSANSLTKTSAIANWAVKYYAAPSSPSNVKITYSKSRLTIKEPWTISWTAATATNSNSPVKGYRIRIYKNGTTIPIYNNAGTLISTDIPSWGADRYYYDSDSTGTTFTFYPDKNNIAPGDIIKIGIHAYTKNGQNTQLFSTFAQSDSTYNVQNAGIVRVKVNGTWKEGQVWVKVNNAWKEATSVHTKVNGSWKESK